jgi:hypothetical protein
MSSTSISTAVWSASSLLEVGARIGRPNDGEGHARNCFHIAGREAQIHVRGIASAAKRMQFPS